MAFTRKETKTTKTAKTATKATAKKSTAKKSTAKKTVEKKTDICDLIAQKRADILDEEQKKRLAQSDEGMAVVKTLRKFLPKLKEARRIYKTLEANGFVKKDESMHYGKSDHRRTGYFLSDCWFHWEGFSSDCKTYCTMGGGCNRFACGIDIDTGDIMIGLSEFGTPCMKLRDGDLIEMLVKGGNGWRFTQGCGYAMSGMEVVGKLKYICDNAEAFCQSVTDYAKAVISK